MSVMCTDECSLLCIMSRHAPNYWLATSLFWDSVPTQFIKAFKKKIHTLPLNDWISPANKCECTFRGSFLRSDQKQKAAFVCGSSLGPACLKITINRLLTGKTSGKYISKYYYFYCIKPMCVRVRASTVVGSFVCSVARRGRTVWRNQNKYICI